MIELMLASMIFRSRSAARASAAIGVACLLSLPLAAQGGRGPGGPGGGFGGDGGTFQRPAYSSQHLAVIEETLTLDEGQAELVKAFLDSYTTRYNQIGEEARDEMEFLREEMRGSFNNDDADRGAAFETIRTRMAQFQAQRDEAAAVFVTSLQSVLTEEQMERWPQFERTMRRIQQVPLGTMSGESVDLFTIVETSGISDTSQDAVQPTLAEYEAHLDVALQQRQAELADNDDFRNTFRAIMTGEADLDDLKSDMDKRTKVRMRVRDLNDMYATQIESLLADPEEASDFRAAYRDAAYPRVWDETWGEQVFAAALELEGIDESVLAQVEALALSHADGLLRRNEKLEAVVRKEEPAQNDRRIEMMAARMNGEDVNFDDDPMREAFRERGEYEDGMVTQLRALLTEDQIRQLPRRPDNRGGPGNFGGGGRGPGGQGGFGGGGPGGFDRGGGGFSGQRDGG